MAAAEERKIPNESRNLRLFVYILFVASTVMLLIVLGLGSPYWLAPTIGVVVSIGPTILFYLREQDRQEQREAREAIKNQRTGGSFDFTEDDDPTQPPTRKAIQN